MHPVWGCKPWDNFCLAQSRKEERKKLLGVQTEGRLG